MYAGLGSQTASGQAVTFLRGDADEENIDKNFNTASDFLRFGSGICICIK